MAGENRRGNELVSSKHTAKVVGGRCEVHHHSEMRMARDSREFNIARQDPCGLKVAGSLRIWEIALHMPVNCMEEAGRNGKTKACMEPLVDVPQKVESMQAYFPQEPLLTRRRTN